MPNPNLKRTPLYESHLRHGGKMVAFAGWEMPVQYSGVIPEHQAVRGKGGLFDVSHMGEIFVTGTEAEAALDYLTCNAVKKLTPGKAHYSAIVNPTGGVVDDIIIYKYSSERYLVCVNASNADKDFEWFLRNNIFHADFKNASNDYGQIAVQGPRSPELLAKAAPSADPANLKYFHFTDADVFGHSSIIARTGYTGETGFEIFTPAAATEEIWEKLLELGAPLGVIPCGLGARDSLRLEACYPLHGHELAEDISAIESGLGWIVKIDKGDFIGRDALAKHLENGPPRKLAAFLVEDSGIARQGDPIFDTADSGTPIGSVTSGTKTPTINRALGLALVKAEHAVVGRDLYAEVRGRRLRCTTVKPPFYSNTK